MKKVLVTLAVALTAIAPASTASATVHEIVGQWCAGRGDLFPPGISGGSNADNFARPLFANGFATVVAPFDPPGEQPVGVLIQFDFDHPASKISGLGFFVQVDTTPGGDPVYIEAFELKSGHGFTNCARLRT